MALTPLPHMPGVAAAEVAGIGIAVQDGERLVTLTTRAQVLALSADDCARLADALREAAGMVRQPPITRGA